MRILAIDTTGGACSTALWLSERGDFQQDLLQAGGQIHPFQNFHHNSIYSSYKEMPRGHAEALLPQISRLMSEAGIDYQNLHKIAVTMGPGTFTGVRIGLAAAKGLSLAHHLPLVGATTLHVMGLRWMRENQRFEKMSSEQPCPEAYERYCVAQDARRGELFVQLFNAQMEPENFPQSIKPDMLADYLPNGKTLIMGSGVNIARTMLSEPMLSEQGAQLQAKTVGFTDRSLHPHALDLLSIAAKIPEGGKVAPIYCRPADAKPQQGKSLEHQSC